VRLDPDDAGVIDEGLNLMLRLPESIAARARRAWWNALGARIRGGRLGRVSIPRNPWDIEIEDSALDEGVILLTTGPRRATPRIQISGTYINRFTMLDASERIELGPGCMLGPYCYVTDHDHGMAAGSAISTQPLVSAPVRLGRDVWLGAGAVVLKGVTIGDGAVVGAGAVITRDVAAGAIVAGVPGRAIGART
jgi:maltose O-acetyltransferase